jgi:hypothetical protein
MVQRSNRSAGKIDPNPFPKPNALFIAAIATT